ncbi:MAG: hypothetical protein AAB692_01255 [Patescibacteria group bacterium]
MMPRLTKGLLIFRFIPVTFIAGVLAAMAFIGNSGTAPANPPANPPTAQTSDFSWVEKSIASVWPASKKGETATPALNEQDQHLLSQALTDFWQTSWRMALPWSKTMAGVVWDLLGRAYTELPNLLVKAGINVRMAPADQDPRLGSNAPIAPVLLRK